jgi:transketolase
MCAAHYKLNNLTFIIDYNKFQSDAPVWDSTTVILEKFRAFGWWVDIVNGHDYEAMDLLFQTFNALSLEKPRVAIANTIKGKGVSFMEREPEKWHSITKLSDEDYARAMQELRPVKEIIHAELAPTEGAGFGGNVVVKHRTKGGKEMVGQLYA